MKALKILFGIVFVAVLLAVVGRVFFFDLAKTFSYSMVPTLVAGDLFVVNTFSKIGLGDVAVCEDPEEPGSMVVLRVVGVPGTTVSVRRNHLVLDGEQVDREMVDPIIYVDRTSDEEMEYAVRIGEEYVGGQLYKVAMMDRAGGKSFYSMEVPDGHFFLMGDNRNLARDSREFDVVPIESCVGQATFLLWPAEDSGDLKRDVRAFEWIH